MTRPRIMLAALAAATVIGNLFVHPHGADAVSDGFGFHAWYAALVGVLLVGVARVLGRLLSRPDSNHDV